jgi:two-component system, chemotaxis family, chemotaxis protein CheY
MKISSSKIRVLIVDDFALARLLVRNALAPFKIGVIDTAVNGEEALSKIQSSLKEGQPFSLVFSDVSMPGMNGLQLLEACRAKPETKGLNFVIITAQGEQKDAVAALARGAADYITKPFGAAEFESKVARIFESLGIEVDSE